MEVFRSEQARDHNQRLDYIMDCFFVALYIVLALVLFCLSCKSFTRSYNKNVYNFTIVISLLTCYGARITSILENVIMNDNEAIEFWQKAFYVHYQLPFDLLNISLIAHYFQWVEGLSAFLSIASSQKRMSSED